MLLTLSVIRSDGSVIQGKTLTLNQTFAVQQRANTFRLSPVGAVRAHGDRVVDTAWLAGEPITIIGYIGAGGGAASGGDLSGSASDMARQYLGQLRSQFARLHRQGLMILDFGNGWFMYVRCQQPVQSKYIAGFPDLREITIVMHAADPLCYSTTAVEATIVPSLGRAVLTDLYAGMSPATAPTTNWVLTLQAVTTEQDVLVTDPTDGTAMTLTIPVGPDRFVVDGYKRSVYLHNTPTVPAWDRWGVASEFPVFSPDVPSPMLVVSDTVGTPLNLTTAVTATLKARAADWLPDTVDIQTMHPLDVAEYGVGEFGQDSYG